MSGERLQFVVGKGGVGKSTVATALAVAAAAAGRRTLLIEIGGAAGSSRLLGVEPEEPNLAARVSENLFLMYVEGDSALAEYLALVVPVRRVLRAVFESNAYRSFVAAAPGLKELMTVGKIWYEATREEGGGPWWESVVVDAGASGHSLQYLEMPQAAARTFQSGLVHRESERVAGLLADAATTTIHVVATPEDMPLVEAGDIVARLEVLGLPIGKVFVNRCRPSAPEGADAAIALAAGMAAGDESSLAGGVADVARTIRAWERVQQSGIDALEARTGRRAVRLPLLAVEEFGARELQALADCVARPVPAPEAGA
jgi:anion-transporting  ArsA/GET3 family ATPase